MQPDSLAQSGTADGGVDHKAVKVSHAYRLRTKKTDEQLNGKSDMLEIRSSLAPATEQTTRVLVIGDK